MASLAHSLVVPCIVVGILCAPCSSGQGVPQGSEILVYLDVSKSFIKHAGKVPEDGVRKQEIVARREFRHFMESEVGGRQSRLFAFAEEVSEVEVSNAELEECRNVKAPACLHLDEQMMGDIHPLLTSLEKLLEHAAGVANQAPQRQYLAYVFTDLVDDCVGNSDCLHYEVRDDASGSLRLSEILRAAKNLEIVVVVGGTLDTNGARVKRSRNHFFRRIYRDFEARSTFVVSDDYEWDHLAFDEPVLRLADSFRPISRDSPGGLRFLDWRKGRIEVSMAAAVSVERMDFYCDGRVLPNRPGYAVRHADREGEGGEADDDILIYMINQSPCSLPSCRPGEELFLRVAAYNSLVTPVRLERPSTLCYDRVKLDVYEDPDLSLSTVTREVFHSGDKLKLEFDALLQGGEVLQLCLFDASQRELADGVAGRALIDGKQRLEVSPRREGGGRFRKALARLSITFGSERPELCRYSCYSEDEGESISLSLKESLDLTTAKAPAIMAYVVSNGTQGSLDPCAVDGTVESLAIGLRPRPKAHLLLLLRVFGCLLIVAFVFGPFRIVRRVPMLSTFAVFLAVVPLLIEVQPHFLMKILRAESLGDYIRGGLYAFLVFHIVLFGRAFIGDLPTFYGDRNTRTLSESQRDRRGRAAVHFGAVVLLCFLLWGAYSESSRSNSWIVTCKPSSVERKVETLQGDGKLLRFQ